MVPGQAAQLEQKTFRTGPRPHPRRVQGLEGGYPLGQKVGGDPFGRQIVQILLVQPAPLVQQADQVLAQGQERGGQVPALQLFAQVEGQGVSGAIDLAGGGVPFGRVPHPGCPGGHVPPGLADLPGLGLLQNGVFQGGLAQVIGQLQGVHLQNLHGLQDHGGEF